MQFESLLRELRDIMDEEEDNLRIYRLREPKEQFLSVYGRDTYIDFGEPLIL